MSIANKKISQFVIKATLGLTDRVPIFDNSTIDPFFQNKSVLGELIINQWSETPSAAPASAFISPLTPNIDVSIGTNAIQTGSLFTYTYGTHDDLVLYIPFSEDAEAATSSTVFDVSGFGNDGVTGGNIVINSTLGKYGKGLQSTATVGSFIKIPITPSIIFNDVLTCEAWIFPERDGNTETMISNTDGNAGFQITRDAAGTLNILTRASGGNPQSTTGPVLLDSMPINKWTHLAFSLEKTTGLIRIFINGKKLHEQTGGILNWGLPTNQWELASGFNGFFQTLFKGKISQFKAYHRLLLTAEIRTSYLRGTSSLAMGVVTADKFRVVDKSGAVQITVTGGRLGIATPDPAAGLDVKGSAFIEGRLSFNATGTIGWTVSGTILTGTGTEFITELNVGDRIQFSGNPTIVRTVIAIASKTSLTVDIQIDRPTDSGVSLIAVPSAFKVTKPGGTVDFIINDQGSIGVGTASPDVDSILDLVSTTKGFLLPRLTTVQKDAIIATPIILDNTEITLAGGKITVTASGGGFAAAGIVAGSTLLLGGTVGVTGLDGSYVVDAGVTDTVWVSDSTLTGIVTEAGSTTFNFNISRALQVYDTTRKAPSHYSGEEWRESSAQSPKVDEIFTDNDLPTPSGDLITLASRTTLFKDDFTFDKRFDVAVGGDAELKFDNFNIKLTYTATGILFTLANTSLQLGLDSLIIDLTNDAATLFDINGGILTGRLLFDFCEFTLAGGTSSLGNVNRMAVVRMGQNGFTGFKKGISFNDCAVVSIQVAQFAPAANSTGPILSISGIRLASVQDTVAFVSKADNRCFFISANIVAPITIRNAFNFGPGEFYDKSRTGTFSGTGEGSTFGPITASAIIAVSTKAEFSFVGESNDLRNGDIVFHENSNITAYNGPFEVIALIKGGGNTKYQIINLDTGDVVLFVSFTTAPQSTQRLTKFLQTGHFIQENEIVDIDGTNYGAGKATRENLDDFSLSFQFVDGKALGKAIIGPGPLAGITVADGGTDYIDGADVTFVQGAANTADGNVIVALGVLTDIEFESSSDYTSGLADVVGTSSGKLATVTLTVPGGGTGTITSVTVTASDTDFQRNEVLTVTQGAATNAVAAAIVKGIATSVGISDMGSGYVFDVTTNIISTGPGSDASGPAIIEPGPLTGINNITGSDSNWVTGRTANILSKITGTGATGTITTKDGLLISITAIVNAGAGFEDGQAVTLSGVLTGDGATGTANVSGGGFLDSINLLFGGSNFINGEGLDISSTTSTEDADADVVLAINNVVDTVAIDTDGTLYTGGETLDIEGSEPGTFTTKKGDFTAVIDAGTINAVATTQIPGGTGTRFTASTTPLNGLITGDFVVHTGFIRPENNGLFKISNLDTDFYDIPSIPHTDTDNGSSKSAVTTFVSALHDLDVGEGVIIKNLNYEIAEGIRSKKPNSFDVRVPFNSGTNATGTVNSVNGTALVSVGIDALVGSHYVTGQKCIIKTDASSTDATGIISATPQNVFTGVAVDNAATTGSGVGFVENDDVTIIGSETGTWDTGSIDQTDPRMTVIDSPTLPGRPGSDDSMIAGGWDVADNATQTTINPAGGEFGDFNFGGKAVPLTINERVKLVNVFNGEMQFTGTQSESVSILMEGLGSAGTGGSEDYDIKLLVDRHTGLGFKPLVNDILSKIEIKTINVNFTFNRPVKLNPGDNFKWVIGTPNNNGKPMIFLGGHSEVIK